MTSNAFQSETRRLAYDQTPGTGPGIVFLGGFNSTRDGTKATELEAWAKARGRAYLRFDYSGHGGSSGRFEEGTITRWTEDAVAIIEGLTEGPQIIVGSSMGGWIACLLAQRMPRRLAGLVTIAAAPDFTEDRYWAGFDADQRRALEGDGFVLVDSPYDDKPYRITRDLIEDGRANRVLTRALGFPCPTRILHGSADAAIPVETAYRLFDHAEADDMRLIVVKGADHRFSSPACLELIKRMIDEVGGPKDSS